jgi:hypothetical protein
MGTPDNPHSVNLVRPESGRKPASGGAGGSGGAIITHPDAASTSSEGGAGGSGGSGGSGGDSGGSGGAGGSGASDGGSSSDSDGGGLGQMLGFYEAEAIPPNMLIAPAVMGGCGATNPVCPPPTQMQPEAMCCSGGKEVRQLLRGRGGLQFNAIAAPTDGMYDVTWWYHCGLNDNFGDPGCGGEPHTPSGCRPAQLVVNGTTVPRIWQFPCFPGPWGQIHAATTLLALKAGMNSIKITAGVAGRDAVDLDAISIFPAGKGIAPTLPKTK